MRQSQILHPFAPKILLLPQKNPLLLLSWFEAARLLPLEEEQIHPSTQSQRLDQFKQ